NEAFAQCEPQLLHCNAAIQGCDLSNNSPQYWNDLVWWDNSIQSHDLAETKIDLSLSVLDTCSGDPLAVRCLLFLDLDGDGLQETVVDSDNPPAAGQINFNNAFNPNYSGGTPRIFDQRPVPANLFWRFELRTDVSGDTVVYQLNWVNDAAPNIAEMPELAYGTHKVRWVITNAAGLAKTCEKIFLVKDCKAPTVVCINGLSVNVSPTQLITLWASDFLQYTEDNVTPAGQIKTGIRKSGTGTGFPVDGNENPITSVVYNCDELGTQSVELWAIDAAGNADFCETYVIVQDNLGYCSQSPLSQDFCAKTYCFNDGLEEVVFEINAVCSNGQINFFDLSDAHGCIDISPWLPSDCVKYTATPSFDGNPLINGVTLFDLLLIQKHIDGIEPFNNPYQWIAADINRDQIVDTFDIRDCRKLILGIWDSLPDSWRFVDKSFSFPDPNNPLATPFPESITVDISNPTIFSGNFAAVKICDVNCTAVTGFYDRIPETEHLIGIPAPNPTNEAAMLPLQLLGAERVYLEVLDFSGRLVSRSEMYLPEGPSLLEIPTSAMPHPGVYVWRVRAGEVVKSGKIVRY
ncbi:MAG: hypothetical protein Q7T20_18705, partial [Saprospiraceae bacterium]|nr:hypothetical protein [Saprospiraceae bacterium]